MPLLKREDTFTKTRNVKPHFANSRAGGANLKKRVTIVTKTIHTDNEYTLKGLKDNNVCLAAALGNDLIIIMNIHMSTIAINNYITMTTGSYTFSFFS